MDESLIRAPLPTPPSPSLVPSAPLWLRGARWLGLFGVLMLGALTVLLGYPLLSSKQRQTLKQRWSRLALRSLGIRCREQGEPPHPGALLVANHISWLDIFAVNAIAPSAFVSKAEVRQWPLIGWLAARNDTVFLRRGSRGHARIVNAEIARHLAAGGNVAVFPEGTTTDGRGLLHFHAALLQPAIEAQRPIQTLALRYANAQGQFTEAAAYCGDMSLLSSARRIVAARGLHVDIHVFPAQPTDAKSERRVLAAAAHAQIARHVLDGALITTAPTEHSDA